MATPLETKLHELHAAWGDRGFFGNLLPLHESCRKEFTEMAQAMLKREASEKQLQAQRERLYNSASVRCYLPGLDDPVIMQGNRVRELANQFLIAPNGEYFVPIARAFWNRYAPTYSYPSGEQRKSKISWTLLKDPTDWSSGGRAIEGFDYERHGFVTINGGLTVPHHAEYEPTSRKVGWLNAGAMHEDNFY